MDKVNAIIEYVKTKTDIVPEVAIIVTSGFKNFEKIIENKVIIHLTDIKGITVLGKDKENKLVFGRIAGKNVVVLIGRMHAYFGYTPQDYACVIFAMKELGCKKLITATGVGAISKRYKVGDLFIANDYINFSGTSSLNGLSEDTYGSKYFDISVPYNLEMNKKAMAIAKKLGMRTRQGVLIEFSGPNSETAAEIKMAHLAGADVVGSHIIKETVLARYCGLKTISINLITNYASGYSYSKVKYEDIHYNLDVSTEYFGEFITEVLKVI